MLRHLKVRCKKKLNKIKKRLGAGCRAKIAWCARSRQALKNK